ncbi:MAG: hypothetical protein FJX74_19810 [Armatimonadetes bacterium]|nr:hypothetical protein [Armatimonadota bacterium]
MNAGTGRECSSQPPGSRRRLGNMLAVSIVGLLLLAIGALLRQSGRPPTADRDPPDADAPDTSSLADNTCPAPLGAVIDGPKAARIRRAMRALASAQSGAARSAAETALLRTLGYDGVGDLGAEGRSCVMESATAPHLRVAVGEVSAGTAHPLDFVVLHDRRDAVDMFAFSGSEKGCGEWRLLEDLDGDAVPEVVVKHYIGEYQGIATLAVWPAVFRWDGHDYVRADDEYPRFYAERVLPECRRLRAEVEAAPRNGSHEELDRQLRHVTDRAGFLARKNGRSAAPHKP